MDRTKAAELEKCHAEHRTWLSDVGAWVLDVQSALEEIRSVGIPSPQAGEAPLVHVERMRRHLGRAFLVVERVRGHLDLVAVHCRAIGDHEQICGSDDRMQMPGWRVEHERQRSRHRRLGKKHETVMKGLADLLRSQGH